MSSDIEVDKLIATYINRATAIVRDKDNYFTPEFSKLIKTDTDKRIVIFALAKMIQEEESYGKET